MGIKMKEMIEEIRTLSNDLFVFSKAFKEDDSDFKDFAKNKSDKLHELAEMIDAEINFNK